MTAKEQRNMTPVEIQTFLEKFQRAWASRNDADFVAIWNPDGQLIYPFANRIIKGKELPLLNAITKKQLPDLKWRMVDWTTRGNVVVVEWECSNQYGEHVVAWRGVDKITLMNGRITEEIVYADTGPLQAMRQGTVFPALISLPDPAT
jgi:hypothetical protein